MSKSQRRLLTSALAIALIGLIIALFIGSSKRPHVRSTISKPKPTVPTTLPPPPPPPPPEGVSPLTGLMVPLTNLNRPALVVKIDNVDGAFPQTGVDKADIVYEEMVEEGLTRLAATFQSQDPGTIGPVRSGRTTDLALIGDLGNPLYAFSGANNQFLPILQHAPVVDLDADVAPQLYHRQGPHQAPHNLYTSSQALYGAAGNRGGRPLPQFTFRPLGTPYIAAGVAPASSFSLGFPKASVSWAWNGQSNTWSRTQNGAPDTTTDGPPLQAANVIIQSVAYQTVDFATYPGKAPVPIPEGQLVGGGQCWIASGGAQSPCTWNKPAVNAVTGYFDPAGHPIALQPGITWVELLPAGSAPNFQG